MKRLTQNWFFRDLVRVAVIIAAIMVVAHFTHHDPRAWMPLSAMAVLNADAGRAASRNFRAIFFNELRLAADQWWRDLFTIVPSDVEEEIFVWMVGNPTMREWIGDRRIKNVAQASFKIRSKEWEATISVLRTQIIFDKLAQVRLYIQQLGQSFPQHYADMAVDLIVDGFSSLAYDNQFYFDTDHDAGDGNTYFNTVDYKISGPSWAQIRRQPARLVDPIINPDDRKRYLNVRYTDVFGGPDVEVGFDMTWGIPFLQPGVPNIYYNNIPADRRHIVPELAGLNEGYFFADLSKPMKPFVLMIVKGVDFVALDKPDDWNVFNHKEYVYGIDSIDNAGYALWELAFASTGTTAAL